MLLEIMALAVGAWASWQDLHKKKFNMLTVLASLIILLLGILQNWPAGGEAALIGLTIGMTLQILTDWQSGDTILLTMYSAVFLHPFYIMLATISTSFVPALFLAREKGKGATIPYAPFLTLAALVVEAVNLAGGLT